MQCTAITLRHRRCSTCPLPLTQSITWRSCVVFGYLVVSAALCTRGLHSILEVVGNTFAADLCSRRLRPCCLVSHKGRSYRFNSFSVEYSWPTRDNRDTWVTGTSQCWRHTENGFCRPGDSVQLQSRVSACVGDVGLWMQSNRLQLKTSKTEVLWFASARRQPHIPDDLLMLDLDTVQPVKSVRHLTIHFDPDLSIRGRISHELCPVASQFYAKFTASVDLLV